MHEYSIVSSLVRQVESVARDRGATVVHRLHVRIGELSGVELPLFETAYDTFRERTICESAALEVQTVPAAWACPSCGERLERGAILRCPTCEIPARLLAGDEIFLDRIEMEVA